MVVRWLPSFVLRPLPFYIRDAAGSEASRVPLANSKSIFDAFCLTPYPSCLGASLQDRPFRHGFSWAVSKAGDFGGPPFSRTHLKVPGGGRTNNARRKYQRLHEAVCRQRIDVSMDNGTRILRLCEADRSDGVMGRIASLGSCVQVSSV